MPVVAPASRSGLTPAPIAGADPRHTLGLTIGFAAQALHGIDPGVSLWRSIKRGGC